MGADWYGTTGGTRALSFQPVATGGHPALPGRGAAWGKIKQLFKVKAAEWSPDTARLTVVLASSSPLKSPITLASYLPISNRRLHDVHMAVGASDPKRVYGE
jgi:hypothetical protein